MRKLLRMLNRWHVKNPDVKINKWQREVIHDFIIDYLEEVKKYNG